MSNPLLTRSDLPYGLPDFTRLETAHYRDAIEVGMQEQRRELQAILDEPAEPSFENTVLALEKAGRTLRRALRVFHNLVASDSDDQLLALESELAPQLAAHRDAIQLDPRLFARVAAVHDQLAGLGLDPESEQLVRETWRSLQLSGAGLDEDAKQRLMQLNQELSTLTTSYQKNLLADTNDLAVLFDTAE